MTRRAINPLEVKALYEAGKTLARMAAELGISRSTLRRQVARLQEAGALDEQKRARHHRPPRGGRRRARISYDEDELLALRAAGLGAVRIRKLAQSLSRRATVWHVRRILDELTRKKVQTSALEKPQPKAGGGGCP